MNPYPIENLIVLASFFTIFFFRRVYGIKTIKFNKDKQFDRRQLFAAAGGNDILKPKDQAFEDNLEYLDAEEEKQRDAEDQIEKKLGDKKGRFALKKRTKKPKSTNKEVLEDKVDPKKLEVEAVETKKSIFGDVFSELSIKGTLDILTSGDTKTRMKTNYIIELANYVILNLKKPIKFSNFSIRI